MLSKANNGTGNNVDHDEWQTPKELFDTLNEQYNFTLDCCATKYNTKCRASSPKFQFVYDYKIKNDICWMNPPFSKAKDMFTHFFEVVTKGVAIYRCDNMETKVWQDIILKKAHWIFIPKGRINYEGSEGKGSRFPSALIGFNVKPPKNLKGVVFKT